MRKIGEIGFPGRVEGDDHILLTETKQIISAAMMEKSVPIRFVNGRERRGERTEIVISVIEGD